MDERKTMDDWAKMVLGQGGAAAIALEAIEQQDRMTQTTANSVLEGVLAAEYRRAKLLNCDLERAAGFYAGLKHWLVSPDDIKVDRLSTISEMLQAQEASQWYLAKYSSLDLDEARSIAEAAQARALHASLEPFRTSIE